MDQLLFHPKVVHLPIALAVLMPFVTGGLLIASWRGWLERRTWVIAVLLQAALLGSAALAMNTGEHEEERVEEIVPEQYIDAHEEAAEAFIWASAGVLLLMAIPVLLPEGRARRLIATAAVVGTFAVLGLGVRTGEAGGALVYVHGAAQVYVNDGGAATAADEAREKDSDQD